MKAPEHDPSPVGDTPEHAGHDASSDPAGSSPRPDESEAPRGDEGEAPRGERDQDAAPRFSSESERLANREP